MSKKYFEILKIGISVPEVDPENAALVSSLQDDEKAYILALCDVIQNSIDIHCEYLLGMENCFRKIYDDPYFLFESCFELVVLKWCLIIDYFAQKGIKDYIGQVLCLTIEFSFSVHKVIFQRKSFNTFSNAFISRQEFYTEILPRYFHPNENQTGVNHELYISIIEKPLAESETELEVFSYKLANYQEIDFLSKSFHFTSYLTKTINFFMKIL